jgi:hypothetical protein
MLHAPVARAMPGFEGTFEYAIDAPWRVEPSAFQDGVPQYGAIPINISIHDVNNLGLDREYLGDDLRPLSLGRVCSVTVRERTAADPPNSPPTGPSRTYPFSELAEVERTLGRWLSPEHPDPSDPEYGLCRAWAGEDCSDFAILSGSSEWHASFGYEPSSAPSGVSLSLQVEVLAIKDPSGNCDDISEGNHVRLINELRVYFAPSELPRFDSGWLYGDLHYHSQGTDNEGEAAYGYRSVVRAMAAMGMDFAYVTEHASNSQMVIDVDTEVGDIFDIQFPPSETRNGLRDMSAARFRFLHDLLNDSGGVNAEAPLISTQNDVDPLASIRPVPQLFLGGEVDLIPELAPGTAYGDTLPWGNGQEWSTENLCIGELLSFGPIQINCEGLGIQLLEETVTDPDAVLVDDIQGFSIDYARHHVVYLPRSSTDRDAFVRSDTGAYGGAGRRFVELKPEFEAHGYFFAAHSLSHFERDGVLPDFAPNDIPWTDHLHDQVWRSPSFLGLQFWNEDSRLHQKVEPWSATTVTVPFPAAEFCSPPIIGPGPNPSYICTTPGDDIGYNRYDSHILGIPYAYLPVQNAQAGFGSGLFHLDVAAPQDGVWDKQTFGIEEKLHHGAFTLDRLNHWGLDIHKTLDLQWLASFLEPRKLFMAGGSDAHGDLNYRRTGYLVRTEGINSTALGKPRNLVEVVAAAPGVVHTQEQVASALANGRFAITNGPALRIAADLNHNDVVDEGDAAIGEVVKLDPTFSLPLLVEWKSTEEYGPVVRIDLYVGARSSQEDLGRMSDETPVGRTYAPLYPGVFHPSIPGYVFGQPVADFVIEDPPYNRMNDNYWEDPTGLLRFEPAEGFAGTQSVALDLSAFPAMDNLAADRFFVRAFAITAPPDSGCGDSVVTDGCLERYAFTNPIWAQEDTYLCGADAGLDSLAPTLACNAPATIIRQSLPQSITATSEDLCPNTISVSDIECFAINDLGVKTPRHCVVSASGSTVNIWRADGTGTIVSWIATATDAAGNSAAINCQTEAVNSPVH